jgi:hypothetical protein
MNMHTLANNMHTHTHTVDFIYFNHESRVELKYSSIYLSFFKITGYLSKLYILSTQNSHHVQTGNTLKYIVAGTIEIYQKIVWISATYIAIWFQQI